MMSDEISSCSAWPSPPGTCARARLESSAANLPAAGHRYSVCTSESPAWRTPGAAVSKAALCISSCDATSTGEAAATASKAANWRRKFIAKGRATNGDEIETQNSRISPVMSAAGMGRGGRHPVGVSHTLVHIRAGVRV